MIGWLLACTATTPTPELPPSLPATGAPAAAPAPVVPSVELGSLRVVATGDVLLHETVQRVAERRGGYDPLFAATKPLIATADLAFANLESPIAPKTGKPVVPLRFNASPDVLTSLVSTGFDAVSFANNHVYDQGRDGFAESLDHLDAAHLPYVGAGRTCAEAARARTVSANGLTVAILGTSQLYNDRLNAGPDEPCADTFDLARALAEARVARGAGADLVILSIHWGVEYATAPTEAQVNTAHQLLEGGVDVVLGHHPHVLAPIEVVHTGDGRVGIVAYSLGNYISNQSAWYEPGLNPASTANPRDGVILGFRVVRREYRGGSGVPVVRVELADLVATPLWTRNNGTVRGEEDPDITVEPLLDRIAALRAELSQPTIAQDDTARVGSDLDEMERRWKQVGKIVGEQFLPER